MNNVSAPERRLSATGKLLTAIATAAALATLGANAPASAKTGTVGWQGRFVISVPAGTIDYFFHYPCPAAAPVARSGGFLPNPAAKPGMVVLGNGPRLDVDPAAYNEWAWIFDWPAGAPAGAQISVDVMCTKAPV